MKECKFCHKPLPEEEMVCSHCGYDFSTDTIKQEAVGGQGGPEAHTSDQGNVITRKNQKQSDRHRAPIDPKIKNFAVFGIVLTIFSIFYRYNFNVVAVGYELSCLVEKVTFGRVVIGRAKKPKTVVFDKSELIDVSAIETDTKVRYRGLVVEGIVFVPKGQSYAIINGKVYGEGEGSDTMTVNHIFSNSVEVVENGETKVLQIKKKQ